MIITGIVFAISLPSLLFLLNISRLNSAQDEVFQSMRTAQNNAKHNHIVWQFSLRAENSTNIIQWAVHPSGGIPEETQWKSLDSNIEIDWNETTLDQFRGIRRAQFNHLGRVNGQLGRVTLVAKNDGKLKRCVIVSTLLGMLRRGSDNPVKRDGKSCY